MNTDLKLNIVYGVDQKIGIDNLLKKFKEAGKVVSYTSEITEDTMLYSVQFKAPYDIYLFGYEAHDLLKYLFAV